IFKLLLEIDSFSLKFFSPSSLSVSNLSLLSIFIFSIFSYSLFIYYLVEKGLRNSEELLLAKLALEKQNRETEEASNSKSIFLARVNHELRTPMQAALSASELLPQSPENLPILRAAISQSLLIIEDILDFTRIAKNNMKLQSKKFSLLLGMHELIQVYQSKTPDSVEIQTEFAADIPSHFIGDPTRFFDIIRNLLSNAVKWTNSGIIKVKLYWEDQSYSRLGFTITDNGPGIPDDLIKNIFEPFIQGKLRHTSEQGVGLGLYIARKAVEAMNGSIKVQNRKEGGAIFSFSIALQPCKEWLNANEKENHCYQCPNNPKILQHTIANNKTINYKLKILIVEDVEVNANLLKKLLHREGFQELELAFTGQEAIKKITELRPDIVFLDLNLPDMDGFNIVRTLRERNIEPKYIVLTGDATTDVFEHCREIGLNNILPKPAKINKIMEALHQAQ
ncbi:MAG: response regulator, partial [Leptospiraceae bacterium]|nr:response regulator [Leptospiraceae bacterium]